MAITQLRRDILEGGKEDYSGLWEAVDLVRARHPALDEMKLREIAVHELTAMAKSGLLEFYRGTKFAGEQLLVHEIDDALSHDASWDGSRPSGTEHYRFAITDQGASALREQ